MPPASKLRPLPIVPPPPLRGGLWHCISMRYPSAHACQCPIILYLDTLQRN